MVAFRIRPAWRRAGMALACLLGLAVPQPSSPAIAGRTAPAVEEVEGKPTIPLGNYDLAPLGYVVEEYFLSGTAQSYRPASDLGPDGNWRLQPASQAPYVTRIVVVRPADPARFSGTVVVEWLNVSGGADLAADWNMAHREMLRNGDAYVAVSAQKVGVEGGGGILGGGLPALKQANPGRYARLHHPGDAFAYDIFSQVGRLVGDPASGVMGPLKARRLLAVGESQSATFLVSYVNGVDRLARIFDGYLIHSRFGYAAGFGDDGVAGTGVPRYVRFRRDLRVPVLTLITETDLPDGRVPGYHGTRMPDNRRLRVWEIGGAAHADRYAIEVATIDSGALPIERLAAAYAANDLMGMKLPHRINNAPQQHYVTQAALRQLDRWVQGKAPPGAAPLAFENGTFALDDHGNARGGLRTPWVDVPTARHSGISGQQGFLALMGTTQPFADVELQRLYPGGRVDYLARFTRALDDAIGKGFLLGADRAEILALAAASYQGAR